MNDQQPQVILDLGPKQDSKVTQDQQQDQDQKTKKPKKVPGMIWNSFGLGFSFIGFIIAGVMTALTGRTFQLIMLIFYAIMLFVLSVLLGNKLRYKHQWSQ